MACVGNDDDEKVSDPMGTSSFDAVTHVRNLGDMIIYCGCHVHKWVVCSVGDNCNLNKSIARHLQVPHLGCMANKLNLESNLMVESHQALQRAL